MIGTRSMREWKLCVRFCSTYKSGMPYPLYAMAVATMTIMAGKPLKNIQLAVVVFSYIEWNKIQNSWGDWLYRHFAANRNAEILLFCPFVLV